MIIKYTNILLKNILRKCKYKKNIFKYKNFFNNRSINLYKKIINSIFQYKNFVNYYKNIL